MGYYTWFELDIEYLDSREPIGEKLKVHIKEHVEKWNEYVAYAMFGAGGIMPDEHKWYEHEDDMKLVSQDFPDLVFILTGWGEETGDIWRKYFIRGEMSGGAATIVFPELYKDDFIVDEEKGRGPMKTFRLS